MNGQDYRVVLVTTADRPEAERIARVLIEERLAACVNMIAGCKSIYRWKGEVTTDEEALMIIKTSHDRFDELAGRVTELHSYDVPEVVGITPADISDGYARFLDENLAPQD